MEIIKKNDGAYVEYEISGNKITFDDELMLNLEKYQRDNEVTIDICRDQKTGTLVSGVPDSGKYVAQISVYPREYEEIPVEVTETQVIQETEGTFHEMDGGYTKEALPFDMGKCTLSLWTI